MTKLMHGQKKRRQAKNHKMRAEQRHLLRQEKSKLTMDEFKLWLDKVYPTVLAKSPLGKAIAYCLKYWNGLTEFLNDEYLEIYNNLTEQKIKPFVISRKSATSSEKRLSLLGSLTIRT